MRDFADSIRFNEILIIDTWEVKEEKEVDSNVSF